MIFYGEHFSTVPSTSTGPHGATFMDSPLPWNQFFDKKLDVKVNDDIFCVYTKGDTGPIFYMLHGGGYSGLTWACVAVR